MYHYSPKQLNFLKAIHPYQQLNFGQLNAIWLLKSGTMSKISSHFLNHLVADHFIKIVKTTPRNSFYRMNQKEITFAFPEFLSNIPMRYQPEFRKPPRNLPSFNFHDEALKTLLSQTEIPNDISLVFPRIKNNISGLTVPDAVLTSKDLTTFIEYDNLSERTLDFTSKFPRYLYEAKQNPHQKTNVVVVFTDETIQIKGFVNPRQSPPQLRMENLTKYLLDETRALDKQPFRDALEQLPQFNIYFMTYSKAKQHLSALIRGDTELELTINAIPQQEPLYSPIAQAQPALDDYYYD
jgi:hypothetical protein